MDTASFYGKKAAVRTRVPPVESEDSFLDDSGDSDEEYIPKPGDETSSEEDSSSNDDDAPASISTTGRGRPSASTSARRRSPAPTRRRQRRDEDSSSNDDDAPASISPPGAVPSQSAAAAKRGRQPLVWSMVEQQDSEKDIPIWQGTLPNANGIKEPIDYFRDHFDDAILNAIVEQSNLYCTQINPNNSLKLDQNELEQFIGTLLYMSVIRLPRSRMYWARECRVAQVADVMSRDRWEEIKKFIHLNDNSNLAADNEDKLFKIRPLIDGLLQKFQGLPQDQMLSLDEQMVPFKGKSGLKQYIPKKPYKWGYKIFVLCDTKGLVHSFSIYTGKIDPVPGEPDIGSSGNIVLELAQVIQGGVNHLLYFDNWFSSLNLFVALANKGIPALGTVQQNRLHGCSFSSDTDMRKKGRGTFEEKKVVLDGVEIRAVKWFDNRGVNVASTFASAQPLSTIERWDRKLKRKVSVECPSIISQYNKFMGGVDALDALIAYYRIKIRSKKYYMRFFFHFVDMVVVNSWLLYRRDCNSEGVPRNKQNDLLTFRLQIAQALCKQGKDMSAKKKRGRPPVSPSTVESEYEKKKRRGPAQPIPTQNVRTDSVGHWPVVEKRQRCKLPNCKGQPIFKCAKCNVHLCLNSEKNCFREFHN